MKRSEHLILLDMDRCLLDTEKIHQAFSETIRQSELIDEAELAAAKKDTENSALNNSFDTVSFVQRRLAEKGMADAWDELRREFERTASEHRRNDQYHYLMLGATALIDKLQNDGRRFGILTYGGDIWQHMKLAASGLYVLPHVITDVHEKGLLIHRWLDDGEFPSEFGDTPVKFVTMVDDKLKSLRGLPPQYAAGIHVRTGKPQDQKVPESLPPHIISVADLIEAQQRLKQ